MVVGKCVRWIVLLSSVRVSNSFFTESHIGITEALKVQHVSFCSFSSHGSGFDPLALSFSNVFRKAGLIEIKEQKHFRCSAIIIYINTVISLVFNTLTCNETFS